jgi:glycosyltransferase involved in cell wall biosynthesis
VSGFEAEIWGFDRRRRFRSAIAVLRKASRSYDLVVLEGTGVGGGVALILARILRGAHYVVSTGDAVAPYVGSVVPLLRPFARIYERVLYSLADGVIGWSPYITGRALTLGARRAMTAPHWSRVERVQAEVPVRQRLEIPEEAIVVGVVGSLAWNRRRRYCYGLELIKAMKQVSRDDIAVLIVGDGNGMPRLAEEAGSELNRRVFLPGVVPPQELFNYLQAMDLAVLAQSVDGVGAFRYTSKLSDYLDAGLPVISTQIPAAYDIGRDWMWRLPGDAPWDPVYIEALASLLEVLARSDIAARAQEIPVGAIDSVAQERAVTEFLIDLLA